MAIVFARALWLVCHCHGCHNVFMSHCQQCVMAVNIAVLHRLNDAKANQTDVLYCHFKVM